MSKYLNRVLEVNTEERWAIVEPGVVQEQLNLHLRPMGFLFGPDTSTANRATIGGMMGNNSAGSHSILYGKTIDHVLEMDVVLASGEGRTSSRNDIRRSASRAAAWKAASPKSFARNREEIERRFPKIMRRVSGYNLDEFVRNGKFNLVETDRRFGRHAGGSSSGQGPHRTAAAGHGSLRRAFHGHRRVDPRQRHHSSVRTRRPSNWSTT